MMEMKRPRQRLLNPEGKSFGIFWDEFQSIEESNICNGEEEDTTDNTPKDGENEMQWLNDAGFAALVERFEQKKHIDSNDVSVRRITNSLTRIQAAAVQKRIDALNETIKRRQVAQEQYNKRYKDVRTIFPTKTKGESTRTSKQHTPISNNRRNEAPAPAANSMPPSPGKRINIPRVQSPLARPTPPSSVSPDNRHRPPPPIAPKPKSKVKPALQLKVDKGRASPVDSNDEMNKMEVHRCHSNEELERSRVSASPKYTQAVSPDERPRRRKHSLPTPATGLHGSAPSSPTNDFKHRTERLNTMGSSLNQSKSEESIGSESSRSDDLDKEMDSQQRRASYSKMDSNDSNDNNNLSSKASLSPVIDGDAKLSVGDTAAASTQQRSSPVDTAAFPPLPNFSLTKEDLGMTRVGDLSDPDMQKVRSLSLIELTALFDYYNIPVNRRKPTLWSKSTDYGVFGVPLSVLSQKDGPSLSDGLQAPKFIREIIYYLESCCLQQEGLLRIPGSTQRTKAMKEEIDSKFYERGYFNFEGRKPTDVSTLLKQFLRQLPVPLLTYEYQQTFAAAAGLPSRTLQLQALNLLVLLLPPVHRDTLQLLLVFLSKVVDNEAHNKMGLNNVAMIMAPNLFFQTNKRAAINEVQKAAGMTDVMRMLIKYHAILWVVPGFMVKQIRYLYEAGAKTRDPKAVRKIIAKRMRSKGAQTRTRNSGSGDEVEENDDMGIIRVKAPMFNKTCMAIKLTDKTTANDVIGKFWYRRYSIRDSIDMSRMSMIDDRLKSKSDTDLSRDLQEDYSLYEVGGNIGERRLDSTTNMKCLLKVNPTAEWILKHNLSSFN